MFENTARNENVSSLDIRPRMDRRKESARIPINNSNPRIIITGNKETKQRDPNRASPIIFANSPSIKTIAAQKIIK
jgi:hypothetical protein